MTSSLIFSRNAPAKATDLHAQASPDFAAKLAETQALLQRASAEFTPVTQASSLGAEDVVITHLINQLQLNIPVFVLETGALHTETLALLERTQAHSRAPVNVYRPEQASVIWFIRNEGQDAMYQSIQLRKACCGIRKMEPLARALTGQRAWITGLRQEQSPARAEVPLIDTSEEATKNLAKLLNHN
jgi:phosphoadenosine phosphosulfate reductase